MKTHTKSNTAYRYILIEDETGLEFIKVKTAKTKVSGKNLLKFGYAFNKL